MHEKSPKLLADIRHSAEIITRVCSGKTAADYDADDMLRLAVERSF
jgi:hypothetical protein